MRRILIGIAALVMGTMAGTFAVPNTALAAHHGGGHHGGGHHGGGHHGGGHHFGGHRLGGHHGGGRHFSRNFSRHRGWRGPGHWRGNRHRNWRGNLYAHRHWRGARDRGWYGYGYHHRHHRWWWFLHGWSDGCWQYRWTSRGYRFVDACGWDYYDFY